MINQLPLSDWPFAPRNLKLKENEVHVWFTSLDMDASQLQNLMNILSPDEKDRAERFRFHIDRLRYIASRGILRELLGFYLKKDSAALEFEYNTFGKPFLKKAEGIGELSFNISHSHCISLYALTWGRKVGIDIEKINSDVIKNRLAECTFSPEEVAMLRSLPKEVQIRSFFNCWTRKEAYIKAKGQGLSIPLDKFDVSFVPGEPARLLQTKWDDEEPTRWKFMELKTDPKYAAAVIVEGHGWNLKCWKRLNKVK